MWKNYFIGGLCIALSMAVFMFFMVNYPAESAMFDSFMGFVCAIVWLIAALFVMVVFGMGCISIVEKLNEHHHILEEV